MPTTDEIIKSSKEGHVKYELIEYKGVKLLITRAKIMPLIDITWELTHEPAVKKLAEEMGMKLRESRR